MRVPAHKIKDGARHQKGTTRPGTGPHGVTQDGTATSRNGPPRYGRGPRVRIDTEDVVRSVEFAHQHSSCPGSSARAQDEDHHHSGRTAAPYRSVVRVLVEWIVVEQ